MFMVRLKVGTMGSEMSTICSPPLLMATAAIFNLGSTAMSVASPGKES